MSNERDRIRRTIWSLVFDHCRHRGIPDIPIEDQILSIKGLLIEADNQELPKNPFRDGSSTELGWQDGIEDMLKANFKRVIKEE